MEEGDSKTMQKNYKIYVKHMVTFHAETRTLTKKNKSKIQAMDMKFLRTTEGKGKQEGIELEINFFRKEAEIQNLLIEL